MSTQLNIAFDPGSSLSKTFYQVDDGQPTSFLMEPECLEVSPASIHQRARTGVITPTNDAWIQFSKRGKNSSSCFAIGLLAKQLRATPKLREVKYKSAILKLLTVIGAICETERITEEVIELSVVFMLPWSELSDKAAMQEEIRAKSKKFYFRDQEIRCELERIAVAAEGGGFAFHLMNEHGQDWFTSRSQICTLMLGHRNSSLLTFSMGRVDPRMSETTDLGFIQLVEKVQRQVSGYDNDELTKALYAIQDDISAENQTIQRLARQRDQDAGKKDFSSLASGIESSRLEYIQLIKDWLHNLTPHRSILCIGGGGGYYLHNFLSEHLDQHNIVWGDPSEPILATSEQLDDPSLNRRLIDVWYVFEYYYC